MANASCDQPRKSRGEDRRAADRRLRNQPVEVDRRVEDRRSGRDRREA